MSRCPHFLCKMSVVRRLFVFRNFGWVIIHFTIWPNNPLSCLLPLYHNESSCETIHESEFRPKVYFHVNQTCHEVSFWNRHIVTEMVRWWYQACANWMSGYLTNVHFDEFVSYYVSPYHQGPILQTGFGSFFFWGLNTVETNYRLLISYACYFMCVKVRFSYLQVAILERFPTNIKTDSDLVKELQQTR